MTRITPIAASTGVSADSQKGRDQSQLGFGEVFRGVKNLIADEQIGVTKKFDAVFRAAGYLASIGSIPTGIDQILAAQKIREENKDVQAAAGHQAYRDVARQEKDRE